MIFVDFWTLVAIIVASGVVCGLPLAHMLFRSKDEKEGGYHLVEKLGLALTLGITVPPMLFVLEAIAGIKYSGALLGFNLLLPIIAGLAWAWKEKALGLSFGFPSFANEHEILSFAKRNAPYIALLALVCLAFWVRVQTWGPIYQELDPYFYMYGTRQVLTEGWPALSDDTAWYPEVFVGHRFATLSMYLEAGWYTLYTGGAPYDKYLSSAIASFYPPLAAALMSFWAFVLLGSRYGNKIGVLAAGIFAFLPTTVTKMFAGVSEVQPYGLFALFFMFGAYLLAIRRNDAKIAALAGLGYCVIALGSQIDVIPVLVLGAYAAVEAIRKYIQKEDSKDFLLLNAVFFAGVLGASIIGALYRSSLGIGTFDSPVLFFTGAGLALGLVLRYAGDIVKRVRPHVPAEKHAEYERYLLAGLVVLGLLVFFLTPLGTMMHNYAETAVSTAGFSSPLYRTIAEQGSSGTSFEDSTGFIGFNFTNPGSLVYGFFNLFSGTFNFILHGIVDPSISWLFGINIATSDKANSLMLVFFLLAAISLAYSYLARFMPRKAGEEKHRDIGSTSLFFLLLIFPIAYVGLNKLKYEVFLGIVAALAACVVFGEAEKFLDWAIRRIKYKGEHEAERKNYQKMLAVGMWGLVLLTVFFQFNTIDPFPQGGASFTVSKALFAASFTPRYQDDPQEMMGKMKSFCDDIRKTGSDSAEICGAGYNKSYSDSVEAQYDANLCVLSQFGSVAELQSPDSQLKVAGAQIRCSRLAPYWVDSMEWIAHNTPNGSRIISWWDYGHWINYFGERNTVLRNEHSSEGMIQRVAYAYTRGSTQELIDAMAHYDSKYALFDAELLMSGSGLGGKFGALNYLGCVYSNLTDVDHPPGTSQCETDNMFESVYVPTSGGTPCTISQSQGIDGVVAGASTSQKQPDGSYGLGVVARYCAQSKDITGVGKVVQLFFLDRKDSAGNLVPDRGIPRLAGTDGNIEVYSVLYTKDKIWSDANGTLVGGYDDRQGSFYDSNLYRAFVLRELPGFNEVYETQNGEVKIFERAG